MRPANNVRRPRGRPNRKQHGSSRNQTYDSHGPDVRVRGNATQIYDKYLSLARDAAASGDRVAAEGYFQFAEHYFRIINDSTDPRRPNPQQIRPDQGAGGADQPRRDMRADEPQQGPSSEQPPLEMEQPFIDESQAQGMWPPQVDGARAAAHGGEPAAAAEAGHDEPGGGAEPDPSSRPRRPARGRPRGRRANVNGGNQGGGGAAQEAEDSVSSNDDSEPEGLAT